MCAYSKDSEALFTLLGDRPVAYHPALARALGSATAAIWFSQLLYWNGRGTKHRDNWIEKTVVDFESETGLTEYEQAGAKKICVRLGIIKHERRGLPAKSCYQIQYDAIPAVILAAPESRLSEKWFLTESTFLKNQNLDVGKTGISIPEKPERISEITTEITTDTSENRATLDLAEAKTDEQLGLFDDEATEDTNLQDSSYVNPQTGDDDSAALSVGHGHTHMDKRTKGFMVINSSDLPQPVRDAAVAFMDARQMYPTKLDLEVKGRKGLWVKGLYDLLDACGGDLSVIPKAVEQLVRKGMTVASPMSIVKTAKALANPVPDSMLDPKDKEPQYRLTQE